MIDPKASVVLGDAWSPTFTLMLPPSGHSAHSLHALGSLPGNVDELKHLQVGLLHMQMFVEATAFTPLCHDGEVLFRHVSHEQQDVYMSGLPVNVTGMHRS